MGSKTSGSNEEKQSNMERGCKHFSSGYLGNHQECQRIWMKTLYYLYKGMTSNIFHKDTEQLYS